MFADRCPHRGAPLSAGTVCGASLQCAYHGWRFNSDGCATHVPSQPGSLIPSRARLDRPHAVVERYGLVWLAPDVPITEVPAFPEWDAAGFDCVRSTFVRTSAGAAQLVDNFLDAAHFPFVHQATFGTEAAAEVVERGVRRSGWEIENTFDTWYRNRDDPLVASGLHDEVQPQVLVKRGAVSLCVGLQLGFPVTGATIGILFCCTPERDGVTRVYKLLARNDLGGDAERIAAFVEDEDRILEEDLAILTRYRHNDVPVDLRAEVHTRADRLSVAWRQLLGEALAEEGLKS
ncbi:MAG: Rieske (2Fe-2S) iron-sulfur domain protein [Actinomycetia bacterium]|nr:Rieske (2Fe-2S) iron-sulfur domain protein [Actinomycetes bacterium]